MTSLRGSATRIDLAWPTIVSESFFPDAVRFQAHLVNIIDTIAEASGYSGQKDRLPELTMHPERTEIRHKIPKDLWLFLLTSVDKYLNTVQPDIYKVATSHLKQMWPNIHRPGEFHAPHFHNIMNSVLVGTYYVSVPPIDSCYEACLALLDPRGRFGSQPWYERFYGASEYLVKPEPGKLVLFPPHVLHYVYPHNSSEGARYSISFNVSKDILEGTRSYVDF